MVELPSPNHGPRPADRPIDMLVIHYTGMRAAMAAVDRLCDPRSQVSAHYLIEETGRIWHLVREERRAWHAGVAFWAGERDVNSLSIGIELANPGHEFGYRAFPPAQMSALAELAKDVVERYEIPPHRVLGHSDVAVGRKIDPGELFDWEQLARIGVGLWPGRVEADGTEVDVAAFRRDLTRYGYDGQAREAVEAFQRHYRPWRVDGAVDAECTAILAALLGEMS